MIPILLLTFIYFNIPNILNTKDITSNQIKIYKTKIKKLQTLQKADQMLILKDIEKLSKKLSIEVTNINFNNKKLFLELKSKFINSMNFLKALNKKTNILSLEFDYEKSVLIVKIVLDIKNYYLNQLENIKLNSNISNPFVNISYDKNSSNKISPKAIIGNYVLLGNKWYSVGDKYKKYTIFKIDNKVIELKYNDKIIKKVIFK